jgi:hypothetical protein
MSGAAALVGEAGTRPKMIPNLGVSVDLFRGGSGGGGSCCLLNAVLEHEIVELVVLLFDSVVFCLCMGSFPSGKYPSGPS